MADPNDSPTRRSTINCPPRIRCAIKVNDPSTSGRENAKIHFWLTDKDGKKVYETADIVRSVLTENPVGSENAEVTIIRGIMVATMMSSLFIALFAFVASSFRTRGALQAEILALRHQLAVLQ